MQQAIDSDYGSDFSDEEADIIHNLLLSTSQTVQAQIDVHGDIPRLDYHHDTPQLRVLRSTTAEELVQVEEAVVMELDDDLLHVNPEYPDLSKHTSSASSSPRKEHVVDENDTRPPLQRFRSRPMKAFSVTDLISPSWCELQYFYTMKYHGKKKRTPAMKQGSVVHKELEEEIYTTVKVEITTPEDMWGLRIWNVIQGLRTLKETGHTRELEVWGVIHGQVVTGVIDDVTTICPDQELEDEWETSHHTAPPPNQPTISQFFKSTGASSLKSATKVNEPTTTHKLYLCDVKTRAGQTLPQGASFRPTQYQLMMYHNLLSKMITDPIDFSTLADRYNLDATKPFSDSFIAQIGSLNDEVNTSHTDPTFPASQDSVTILLANNSLSQIWNLMLSTLRSLAPHGRASIGNVLKAEYRLRETGEVLGSKTFPMDDGVLQRYIDYEMQWWKGEREPRGVEVEDAFKCRSCDFVNTCKWRIGMAKRDGERAREKRLLRDKKRESLMVVKGEKDGRRIVKREDHVLESRIPDE